MKPRPLVQSVIELGRLAKAFISDVKRVNSQHALVLPQHDSQRKDQTDQASHRDGENHDRNRGESHSMAHRMNQILLVSELAPPDQNHAEEKNDPNDSLVEEGAPTSSPKIPACQSVGKSHGLSFSVIERNCV